MGNSNRNSQGPLDAHLVDFFAPPRFLPAWSKGVGQGLLDVEMCILILAHMHKLALLVCLCLEGGQGPLEVHLADFSKGC